MRWHNKPEVHDIYFKKTVDYDKSYHDLYDKVAHMLRSVEDKKVRSDLLKHWDKLRSGMP